MEFATLPDGARLAYDVYDFTPPWTTPETIILVHGFTKNWKFFYSWIPRLASHYRVIRVDQRGHGDSSPISQDFKISLRPFSQDLADFLPAIGMSSAHFVMAEFASAVAMDFASTFPERLDSLILPGLVYRYDNSTVDRREFSRIAAEQGSEAWARTTNHLRLPADVNPALREWYVMQQARVPNWFIARLFQYIPTMNLTDRLPLIKAPTLIMVGSEGKQSSLENSRAGQKLIPDAQLKIFDGLPFNIMTSAPDRCIDETLKFLEGLSNRKKS